MAGLTVQQVVDRVVNLFLVAALIQSFVFFAGAGTYLDYSRHTCVECTFAPNCSVNTVAALFGNRPDSQRFQSAINPADYVASPNGCVVGCRPFYVSGMAAVCLILGFVGIIFSILALVGHNTRTTGCFKTQSVCFMLTTFIMNYLNSSVLPNKILQYGKDPTAFAVMVVWLLELMPCVAGVMLIASSSNRARRLKIKSYSCCCLPLCGEKVIRWLARLLLFCCFVMEVFAMSWGAYAFRFGGSDVLIASWLMLLTAPFLCAVAMFTTLNCGPCKRVNAIHVIFFSFGLVWYGIDSGMKILTDRSLYQFYFNDRVGMVLMHLQGGAGSVLVTSASLAAAIITLIYRGGDGVPQETENTVREDDLIEDRTQIEETPNAKKMRKDMEENARSAAIVEWPSDLRPVGRSNSAGAGPSSSGGSTLGGARPATYSAGSTSTAIVKADDQAKSVKLEASPSAKPAPSGAALVGFGQSKPAADPFQAKPADPFAAEANKNPFADDGSGSD